MVYLKRIKTPEELKDILIMLYEDIYKFKITPEYKHLSRELSNIIDTLEKYTTKED